MEGQEVVTESVKKKENKLVSGGKKLGKKVSNFFADFKKFISRGNIVDMAVGVIIGAAFSSIVKALTDKIIMPLINLLLSIGNSDGKSGLEKAYTFFVLSLPKSGMYFTFVIHLNLDAEIFPLEISIFRFHKTYS